MIWLRDNKRRKIKKHIPYKIIINTYLFSTHSLQMK